MKTTHSSSLFLRLLTSLFLLFIGTFAIAQEGYVVCPNDGNPIVVDQEDNCIAFVSVIATTDLAVCNPSYSSSVSSGTGLDASGEYPVGNTEVTFFSGCELGNSCTVTVIVNPPPIVCETQNVTVALDANGMYTLAASEVDDGSMSECSEGGVFLSVAPNQFTCDDIGNQTVTLTVEDNLEQIATCTAVVTVSDINPIICATQSHTAYVDANGDASISVSDIDNGTTAVCPINLSLDETDFDCGDLGQQMVNLIAESTTNTELNTSCPATVMIVDTIPPTCLVMDITVAYDPNNLIIVSAFDFDAGTTDNCDGSLSTINDQDIIELTCADIGTQMVTLVATDFSGNASTCTAMLTVESSGDPLTCITQDITVQLDAAGSVTISAQDIDNGSSSQCGNVNLSVMPDMFDCTQIGVNTVVLTVSDDAGNSTTCEAIVTVEDDMDPTCNAQDVTVYLDESGEILLSEVDINNGSFDNCGQLTLNIDNNNFDCDNLELNLMNWSFVGDETITNNSVNNSLISVSNDGTIYVAYRTTGGNSIMRFNGTSWEFVGSEFPGFPILIKLEISQSGVPYVLYRTANPTSMLNVAKFDGVTWTTVGSSDFARPGTLPDLFIDQDENVFVSYTNTAGADFIKVIMATGSTWTNVGPNISLFPFGTDIEVSSNGEIFVLTTTFSGVALRKYNPLLDSWASVGNSFPIMGVEYNLSINSNSVPYISYKDPVNARINVNYFNGSVWNTLGSGGIPGSEGGFFNFKLNESDIPNVAYNVGGQISVIAFSGGFWQNVGIPVIDNGTISRQFFSAMNNSLHVAYSNVDQSNGLSVQEFITGGSSINLTVTDQSGNTSQCTSMVTVLDTVPPTCNTSDITINLQNGSYTLDPMEVDNGSMDNCDVALSVEPNTFDCMDIGTPVTVTLTATDPSGNSSSCTAMVTVESMATPTCVTQDITVNLDANGEASYIATDIDNGSFAECGPVTLSASPTIFDCAQTGANTVVLTVTDDSGNSSTCTAEVTVVDEIDPTCVPMDVTVSLDQDGLASISVADVDGGSFDNCGPVTVIIDRDEFDCGDIGDLATILTVTDASGNTSQCPANVTVRDTLAPQCPPNADLIVQLEPGQCDTAYVFDLPIAIDNCDPNPMSTAIMGQVMSGDTFAIGTHTIEYVVSDMNPNCSTGNSLIPNPTFEMLAPGASSPDFNSQLDRADSWVQATQATSDYFNVSTYPNFTTAFAGLIITNNPPPNGSDYWVGGSRLGPRPQLTGTEDYVEYIGTTLNSPLVMNTPYTLDVLLGAGTSTQYGDLVGDFIIMGIPSGITFPIPGYDNKEDDFTVIGRVSLNITEGTWQNVQIDVLPDQDYPAIMIGLADNVLPENEEKYFLADDLILTEASNCIGNTDTCSFDIEILDYIPQGLACEGDINFSLDPLTCSGQITPEMVVNDQDVGCLDSCIVTINNLDGSPRSDTFTFDDADQQFQYEFCCGGICCWGIVNVEYKYVPVIECEGTVIEVSCNEAVNVAPPTIAFNCGNFETVLVDETQDMLACDTTYNGEIRRYWQVQDADGNLHGEVCEQVIKLKRFDLSDIDWPDHRMLAMNNELECPSEYGPDVTGVPKYLNRGALNFINSGQDLGTGQSRSLEIGDLDGDNDLDVFVTRTVNFSNSPLPNQIFFNNGEGIFESDGANLGNEVSFGVDLGDLDGDGDLDAFINSYFIRKNTIWKNDGLGNFTNTNQPHDSKDSYNIDLGDLDGDGDLDAFIGNWNGLPNEIWKNDGNGNFTNSFLFLGNRHTRDVILVDIDGDNDLDAITANAVSSSNQPNVVWKNDGSGVFTLFQLLPGNLAIGVDAGDIDQDGDEDIYFATVQGNDELWLNDGTGVFSISPQIISGLDNGSIEFGDIDLDGDLDVVLGGNAIDPSTIWLNTNGVFSDSGLLLKTDRVDDFRLGDFDNDGDLDIFYITFAIDTPNEMWINRLVEKEPLYPNPPTALCNVYAEYEDKEISNTACVRKILRTWTVGEWHCTNPEPQEYAQIIEIVDTKGPVLTDLPTDVTISTGTYICEASTTIDLPTLTDICNEEGSRIDVGTPSGVFTDYQGQSVTLPVGVNTINLTAYDGCGNITTDSYTITVVDQADPIAICDQFTTVAISLDSVAYVTAEAIDDGSFDECGPVTLLVARMDDPGFEDFTAFAPTVPVYCADGGSNIMVGLLVTDAGGNTNMCMVEVEVQDKVDAQLICPSEMEVECNFAYDPDNLDAFFGEVTFLDNCPDANEIRQEIIGELNSCGSGILIREIRLINAVGTQVDFCTQQITFRNGSPLQYSDIEPPMAEITIEGCGVSAIDPSATGLPIIPNGVCQQVGINIENDTFPFSNDGACLKILRTFRVVDWCIENGPGSINEPFEFVQTIKVNNTEGPEFLFVPEDKTVCSFAADCGGITLDSLVATSRDACTDSLEILRTYEIFDTKGTADTNDDESIFTGLSHDAGRYYDLGSYRIVYTAEDRCGNQSSSTTMLTVESCKNPTPYCLSGLSVNIGPMDLDGDGTTDGKFAMLTPDFFDAGSYHTCGVPVTLSFSADTNDTLRTFSIDHVAELQEVQIWVTDELGRSDFCRTFLDVQDNGTLIDGVTVTGRIYTEASQDVDQVEVMLQGIESSIDMTETDGMFDFPYMPSGGNYLVKPEKDYDYLNGVSTLDLVMIQRHLLGLADIESPYKLIAADINRDEKLTASDLLALRKVILGVDTEFSENTSWRFIDEQHIFEDPTDPWLTKFEEEITIQNLQDHLWNDFIAVKIGDVNGNASTGAFSQKASEVRSTKTTVLEIEDRFVSAGEEVEVLVSSQQAIDLFGLQAVLVFDYLEFTKIESEVLDMGLSNAHSSNSILRISIASGQGKELQTGTSILKLRFEAKKDGTLSEMLKIYESDFESEAYIGKDLEISPISIEWINKIKQEYDFIVHTNTPNPWYSNTTIKVELPEDGIVNFKISDSQGKAIMNESKMMNIGSNEIKITNEQIPVAGIYFYEISFGEITKLGKMVKVN